MQEGFDAGLEEGMKVGMEMGRIYAACRLKLSEAEEPLRSTLLQKIILLENLLINSVDRQSAADKLPSVAALAREFGVDAEEEACEKKIP